MNHEENSPGAAPLEPELEARIVAWIAGEASAFEAAELERIIASDSEARAFRDRIATANRLVNEAIRPDPTPLRMSPERRAKLLEALGQNAGRAEENPSVLVYNRKSQIARRRWRQFLAVAAGLMCGIGVLNTARYSASKYKERSPEMLERPLGEMARVELMKKEEKSRASADDQLRRSEMPAKASLAGSRIQSELKDLGSSITQITSSTLNEAPLGLADRPLHYVAPAPIANLTGGASGSLQGPPAPEMHDLNRFVGGVGSGSNQTFTASLGAERNASYADIASPSKRSRNFYTSARVSAQSEKVKERRLAPGGETGWGVTQDLPANPSKELKNLDAALAYEAPKSFPGLVSRPDQNDKLSQALTASSSFDFYNAASATLAAPSPSHLGDQVPNSILFGFGSPSASATEPARTGSFGASKPAQAKTQPRENFSEETNAQHEPVSTFSLHVSDASFRLAQSALARGTRPPPDSIRAEEFYNAFRYDDPAPSMAEKISCRIEQSAHPFLQQRNFVRIAMKVPSVGRGVKQPLRLTVLLDTSGSMEREDRAAAVKRAFATLISLLGPEDRVTLIGFARQPHLLAESVRGDEAKTLLDLLARANPEGGTNMEEALRLGSEQALKQMTPGAQNRIVLLTDGAANLGDAKPEDLTRKIEALRQQGIAFDACGVGLDGLDDNMLEALTRKGDGRYYVLDTPEAADANFAQQLAGALRPAAKNVKVQVRFNPARVASYRLIGFEKHRLQEADFRNDAVDAAELASDEAAVALYQVQVQPQGEGELGEVFVRFREAATGNMVERSWTMPYEPQAPAFDQASSTLQLTGASAILAEKLREDPEAQAFQLNALTPVIVRIRQHYRDDPRVQEFATMFLRCAKEE
ncbi:MAG TPA: von Willebrand factor type A domain-containing protein [Opitutaceae bacterium]|nr:von Willebrand factor type A domain-containing protein [Opitutaceae bacterium]